MNTEEKTEIAKINYRLPGKHVLLFSPTKTKTGIILSATSKTSADYEVALIGKCDDTKVGDRVVFDGAVSVWNIDGVDYFQIHESQIVGYVLNDGVIRTGEIPNYDKDPTAHYGAGK